VVWLRVAEGAGGFPNGTSAVFGVEDRGFVFDADEIVVHSAGEVGGMVVGDRPEGGDDVSVPIIRPCWSGGMPVLAEDAAGPVSSADIEVRDLLGIGYRSG